jgi:hypothetical protein
VNNHFFMNRWSVPAGYVTNDVREKLGLGVLPDLSFTASNVNENTEEGEILGQITGFLPGTVLSLTDDAEGSVDLVDDDLIATLIPIDFESSDTLSFAVTQSLDGATREHVFVVGVIDDISDNFATVDSTVVSVDTVQFTADVTGEG